MSTWASRRLHSSVVIQEFIHIVLAQQVTRTMSQPCLMESIWLPPWTKYTQTVYQAASIASCSQCSMCLCFVMVLKKVSQCVLEIVFDPKSDHPKVDQVLRQYQDNYQTLCLPDHFGTLTYDEPHWLEPWQLESLTSATINKTTPKTPKHAQPVSSRPLSTQLSSQPLSPRLSSSQPLSSQPFLSSLLNHISLPSPTPNHRSAFTTPLKVCIMDLGPSSTSPLSDDSLMSSPEDEDDLLVASLTLGPSDHDPNQLLLGTHKCEHNCKELWIQDLSPLSHMVRLGDVPSDTKHSIHQPPFHKCGPKGKWYCIYSGKTVSIFNDWWSAFHYCVLCNSLMYLQGQGWQSHQFH